MPADTNGDTSHCQPDSDSFHWLELAETKSCDEETGNCLYRVQNISVRKPDDVDLVGFSKISVEHVIQPSISGEGDNGQVALTYVDANGIQLHGIGIRQKLSSGRRTRGECQRAFRTLKRYYEINDIDLGFEIRNICAQNRGMGRDDISEL